MDQSGDAVVPIVFVDKSNSELVLPVILESIRNADFVTIDQEFSGLGNTSGRARMDTSNYYKKLRESAETRRVISMGISCFCSHKDFQKPYPESCDPLAFQCINFDILLFPDGQFIFDGSARRFLVSHGFDMNRWVKQGIAYSQNGVYLPFILPGRPYFFFQNDFMAKVISQLITTKASIVFHNGLTDLAYFYDSFYNPLPKSHQVFAKDTADLFGSRLYDTKVICDKFLNWRIHCLEYCFKKSQRIAVQSAISGKPAVNISHNNLPESLTNIRNISISCPRRDVSMSSKLGVDICELFFEYGFCNAFKQGTCKHSIALHQMDLILDMEEVKGHRKRKLDTENSPNVELNLPEPISLHLEKDCGTPFLPEPKVVVNIPNSVAEEECPVGSEEKIPANHEISVQRLGSSHFSLDQGKSYSLDFGLHSAGFDAFMTGYVFATCLAQLGRTEVDSRIHFKNNIEFVDRLHMTSKRDAFVLSTSDHVQFSAKHMQKISRIRNRHTNGNDRVVQRNLE